MQALFDYFEQFQKLSDGDKQAIAETCSLKQVKKNEMIETVGSSSKTIYFLKTGIARIFYYKDGIDVTEFFALSGNLVARVKSLLTKKTSSKAIQMLADGELIAINATRFFQLFDNFPTIERLFRLILEASYLEVVERLESIQFHSAKERYADLLEEMEIIQKVPLKYVASYLGITQVSLSRIRANHQMTTSLNS